MKIQTAIPSQTFSVIQGRSKVFETIGSLIQESIDIVYIVCTAEDLFRMYYTEIPEKIMSCVKNGGEIRLLTEYDNTLVQLIEKTYISETRFTKLPFREMMIVEKNRQIILPATMRGTSKLSNHLDSVVYTNLPDIVNNMYALCEHLWKTAENWNVLTN